MMFCKYLDHVHINLRRPESLGYLKHGGSNNRDLLNIHLIQESFRAKGFERKMENVY